MQVNHTLYSDFNCPFCYAMHERLHEMNLLALCEWRGVQHASHLPRPMKPWQGSLGAELRHEVAVVQRWRQVCPLRSLPANRIRGRRSSRRWRLLRRDRRMRWRLCVRPIGPFGVKSKDISDTEVIRQLVEQVGGSPEMWGRSMARIAGWLKSGRQPGMLQARLGFPSLSRRIDISLSAAPR